MHGIEGAASATSPPALALGGVALAQAFVAHAFGVALEDMRTDTRGAPRAALARQVAMYLCHVVLRMGVSEVALAFQRRKSTACHALRHVEDLRDDAELDRTLYFLEASLRSATGRAA